MLMLRQFWQASDPDVPIVRITREFDAPPERVWEILVDLAAYAEWNPFTPRIDASEGKLIIGDAVLR